MRSKRGELYATERATHATGRRTHHEHDDDGDEVREVEDEEVCAPSVRHHEEVGNECEVEATDRPEDLSTRVRDGAHVHFRVLHHEVVPAAM